MLLLVDDLVEALVDDVLMMPDPGGSARGDEDAEGGRVPVGVGMDEGVPVGVGMDEELLGRVVRTVEEGGWPTQRALVLAGPVEQARPRP